MGRLDDAAKRKVVELRKAGLSFRKIKAVLELENIKVSAQAIYLFLREFQGRRPGRVRPLEIGSNTSAAHVQSLPGGLQESWTNIRLQNLLRDVSHHAGFTAANTFAKQASTEAETNAKASGSGESSGDSRPEQQRVDNGEENDIQIVSVTSLSQAGQQRGDTIETTSSSGTSSVAFTRRRVTPSPATSSMLAARKRLLDKALTHRMKVATLLRRDHASVPRSDLTAMSQQASASSHYDLTTEKAGPEDGGGNTSRCFVAQRPGLSIRSLHTLPRVGVRLPNRPPAPLTSSAPGGAAVRLQTSGGQGPSCSEGSQQQVIQDSGARGGLQDQIQTLGCEVRSLSLAVKMLVEQHSRLEKEQAQQTHIQKQILCTLQTLVSKAGPCSNVQPPQNKTPSPSSLPAASSSASFNQDTYNFSQVTFSQCSQTQPSYDSLESLEPVEAFKLPVLSPTGINGFPPCSSSESLPLSHTPPQTQPYVGAYPQQNCLIPAYTQSYVPTYDRSQAYREAGSSSCSRRTLQDCSMSAQDEHVNIIKVEGP
ncbi:uncharacterized protein LOC129170873 [Dunckerocampus dactyliophorus]|uniref:uncharacterized protein LOC129170873 n=1 Tax=Dunckerocampus dactyliophorus TaxID=161453 RepID=UPI0024069091|nr:uncharacterized protein LOC129170873 [Dunckerocampus dactyliophorus]XP_054614944.1 uncharacterized protein LOC129170873 [Dunckerocampus dactyliophorus]